MPQLRSGKVVTGSEVKSSTWMVTSPGPLAAGVEQDLVKKHVVKKSPHLSLKRKSEQPFSSSLQPAILFSISSEQCASLAPMQKEQGDSSHRAPDEKREGKQCKRTARSKKSVALPISHTTVCEDWQTMTMAAAACWEEHVMRGTGQGEQLFFSGTTLQNRFSAEIERKEHISEGLNLSSFQESPGSSGNAEIKLQMSSSEEELESMVSHGISCSPEPEVLQPKKGTFTTEMKSTDSVLNLGTHESLSEPKHPKLVDVPEKLDGCSLIELRKPETQKKRKRCLIKKGKTSLMKPKLQGPQDKGKSALLQGLSGQEQTTRGKMHKYCMKEEQQSSNLQKGAESLGEGAKEKLKAVEQDFSTQALKKLKTNENTSEDSKEKEYHYAKSPPVATSGETQSKSFSCHPVRRKCGVQCETTNPRTDQIKCLQSFSGTRAEKVRNVSAKCDVECCRNALNHCNRLLCATEKNPFVRLEACSYINIFVKSSASGTTSSYNLAEFFHVTQDKRKHAFPDGTVEQSNVNCSTSEMQNERPPIKGGLFFNREKHQNREGCFSCCQNESSNSLRRKKQNIGRKPRKNMKIAEKSTMQNISTGVVTECSKCELQTESTVAASSSFTVSALNHKEVTQSASCGHTSDLHAGKKTPNVRKRSIQKKSDTEILAFEGDFKKIPELPVMEKGENSNNVAYHSAALDSLGVLAQVHDVSDSHKSRPYEKMKKENRKLQLLTCQRVLPMSGKNVWPYDSCARTSAWVHKKHRSISERKRLLTVDFKESSDESLVKAVGKSPVSGQLGHLDLYTSSGEINKESTCQITDRNSLTSLETSEYSAMDIYETLRMSHENTESLVDTDKSAVAFNHDDEQDVKATLNLTTKQNKQKKGAVTKRNMSVTVQVDTSRGNTNKMKSSRKVSLVNQTFSDLKPMKVLNTGKLTNFKIPLCRNKPKCKKLESGHSFERKTCSPLEVLDSSSVSRRQKTDEETFLVNAKQQPLPTVSYATSPASVKQNTDDINSEDCKHDDSENLSNEVSALHEHFSSYPHSFFDRPLEPSVLDFCVTEHVQKPSFLDDSCNAADDRIALEINSHSKSRGNLPQHKSKNFPDILEAYQKDVLVIDVIQDDPDLFGTKNEKELALVDSENCSLETAYTSICIKDGKQDLTPEYPVISENRRSVGDHFRHIAIQGSGMLNDTENSCDLAQKAKDIETHQSSRGSSLLGGVTEDFLEDGKLRELDEFLKSFDGDEKLFAGGVPDNKHEKKDEAEESDCKDLVNYQMISGLPQYAAKVNVLSEATVMKSQTNDYRFAGKSSLLPLQNYRDFEPWKMERSAVDSHSVQQILEMIELPRKYCRFYFMTLRGCSRAKCWFWHVPEQGDEKICMAILRAYIKIKESVLLKRAVQIFVKYYREVTPGMDFASQVLNELLISLLQSSLLQEVFQILTVTVQIHTLPAVDVLLKIFEHVASLNIRDAVPSLISTFCKLMDAGMLLELEHFDYIIKFLRQLKVSTQEMNTILNIKSRVFLERYFEKNWLFDFNLAVAEIQHCKEKNDWTKLGALYVNARTGCEHFDDLQKFSLCIAEILAKDSETDRPGVPFCDFADAGFHITKQLSQLPVVIQTEDFDGAWNFVFPRAVVSRLIDTSIIIKKLPHNEADRIFIGRTGISVMYSYHKVLQWTKGRKVLDKLHELQIHFTALKGLTDAERLASRCQIVNKAAEIFLKTGSLEGATWVLRESEWTTNAPLWPCDKTDILNRHKLLCTLMQEYMAKSLYRQAFEVLQNLPGFQNHSDAIDISQYSHLFNKLINACFESKNLGVSSSAVDFMLSKNIAVDFFLLRGLVTALGRSSLWSKARTYYKSALSMGCYPPLQGNLYHKHLTIPSYLSEIEMLLAIEVFLVSNASDIQSPMSTSQTLQIILKRCEDPTVQHNSDYQAAVERLIRAARISDPKLLLKHMTMNVNMDGVYSLEFASALKWLQENMKWAGKVWLFQ